MATASASLAIALLFASLLAGTVFGDDAIPLPISLLERFHAWQAEYNRTYATPEEFQHRFKVYCDKILTKLLIKDCSCWTFAAVASIEGVHKIKTGRLVLLSEQEIVDCDRGGNDHGCHGGYPSSAMAWITRNGGLTTESDYPYVGRQGQCRRDKLGHHAATIRGVWAVQRNNEAMLERAVAGQPVAVSINAIRAFQFYKRGVFSGPCNTSLNHAVTVVGYGADTRGRKYWIVKNS
ncbi:hypothetical protein SETIT_7G059600v2 [Setaria italica]|uniref:Peptidase C1A papain C-terminal domain-containing protein n=1 Tax=Setaria italica TaxID=4555 RepID=A0A368RSU0_SETIT|nr:hypothetical protein SETIT_7G059600v2 [Setaria italica]